MFFILDDDGNPLEVLDVVEWSKWFELHRHDRHIGDDTINGTRVSTVFLGLNHSYNPLAAPLLWETMVFPPESNMLESHMRRYTSAGDAKAGHVATVAAVERGEL
jgi:hypothetical protein